MGRRGDPLGLIRWDEQWSGTTELLVLPRMVAVDSLGGGTIRDQEGTPSDEVSLSDLAFHALREYVPGDDLRHVHWRSSAKTDTLQVRQYHDTRRSHTTVVVDDDETSYADPEDFETAVSVAASVAARADRDGVDVSFLCGEHAVTDRGTRRRPRRLLPDRARLLRPRAGRAPGDPAGTRDQLAGAGHRGSRQRGRSPGRCVPSCRRRSSCWWCGPTASARPRSAAAGPPGCWVCRRWRTCRARSRAVAPTVSRMSATGRRSRRPAAAPPAPGRGRRRAAGGPGPARPDHRPSAVGASSCSAWAPPPSARRWPCSRAGSRSRCWSPSSHSAASCSVDRWRCDPAGWAPGCPTCRRCPTCCRGPSPGGASCSRPCPPVDLAGAPALVPYLLGFLGGALGRRACRAHPQRRAAAAAPAGGAGGGAPAAPARSGSPTTGIPWASRRSRSSGLVVRGLELAPDAQRDRRVVAREAPQDGRCRGGDRRSRCCWPPG